ncbi:MAG TPA: hypothetical protein VGI23_20305, partial [Steroidobacteraceae bacterium]
MDSRYRLTVAATAASLLTAQAGAQETVIVEANGSQVELPADYAGGQIARGGRIGLFGNLDIMDTPFNSTNYTALVASSPRSGYCTGSVRPARFLISIPRMLMASRASRALPAICTIQHRHRRRSPISLRAASPGRAPYHQAFVVRGSVVAPLTRARRQAP